MGEERKKKKKKMKKWRREEEEWQPATWRGSQIYGYVVFFLFFILILPILKNQKSISM